MCDLCWTLMGKEQSLQDMSRGASTIAGGPCGTPGFCSFTDTQPHTSTAGL